MPKLKWTDELIQKEALKFETRTAFKKGAISAYDAAKRKGLLDVFCGHMKNGKIKFTHERVQKEALKFKTRLKFQENSYGAYKAALRNGWLDEVCSHMKDARKGSVAKWTYATVKAEALKFQSRNDFKLGASGAHDAAQRHGWLDEVCNHMELKNSKWTLELTQAEALKYTSRSSFKKGSGGAYDAALRNGWLDDVCSHMKNRKVS